jgi:hypothetical protein
VKLRSASHLTDPALVLEFDELCANDRGNGAQILVHLAEIDRRKLYLPAGYSSMFQYCVQKCLMSEDVAYRRIRVARAARRFPSILVGIADGRLNLTTVVLLAPHLATANAAELLGAAAHQRKSGVELLIARHFPQPDLPTLIEPSKCQELAPEPVVLSECAGSILEQTPVVDAVGSSQELAAVSSPKTPAKIAPLAPGRFGFQTTIDQETRDLLSRAQELLGHRIPSGDVAAVLKRALALLVTRLEKQKFAATDRPQPEKPRTGSNPRYIPNAVRQAVWARDKGQCTFVSESGHQCEARTQIEYDHIDPVARGGGATVRNIRLRCRAHNQFEAEKAFGARFMELKRAAAG